jgi:hypothetical protein
VNGLQAALARQNSLAPPAQLNIGQTFGRVAPDCVAQLISGCPDELGTYCAGVIIQQERDGPWSGASVDFICDSVRLDNILGARRTIAIVPQFGMLEGNVVIPWVVRTMSVNVWGIERTSS